MRVDLPDAIRDAAAKPTKPFDVQQAYRRGVRRQKRTRALGAVAAVGLVALAGTSVLRMRTPDVVFHSGAGNRKALEVTLPQPGSVAPRVLTDGTPVWVVRDDDGATRVFEALSTHRYAGLDWAVGWCEPKPGSTAAAA